jgi:hypothetical protein
MKKYIVELVVSLLVITFAIPVSLRVALASGNYPSGSLVNDNGTIYLIRGNQKVPFSTWQSFTGLGYSLKNVVAGDTGGYTTSASYTASAAAAHPWGSWLSNDGTVYYSTSTGLIGVPSSQIFTDDGGQWDFVVPANKYDIAAINSNSVLAENDSRIYGMPSANAVATPATNPAVCSANTVPDNYGNCGTLTAPPTPSSPLTPSTPLVSSTAPATVQPLPSTQLAQCGTSTTCFNANAQNCALSEATIASALSIDTNASAITNWDSQIQGIQPSSGLCEIYLQLKAATVSLTTVGTQYLISQGETPAQIQQSITAINTSFSSIIGYQFACYMSSSDGLTMLQDLEQGLDTSLDGSINSSNCATADAQGKPIGSSTALTPGSATDSQRISDVREMALALELYYNDNNNYPVTLAGLTPLYLTTLPTAPAVEGTCTSAQNSYTYTQLQSGSNYSLTFCLGSAASGFSAGVHTVSDSGIQ